MKRIFVVILALLFSSAIYASGECNDSSFSAIKKEAINMEKAWNTVDIKGLVSFYDDDFIYMSGNKFYNDKQSVLKHYIDGFSSSKSEKQDLGTLKLDYKYCRNLDKTHQLVILQYKWTSPGGEKAKGYDLLVWQKNKDGKYKIIVDFPKS